MRTLMIVCCLFLTACEKEFVYQKIPETLTRAEEIPSRPLVTYRDAVIRDEERGVALENANSRFEAIRKLSTPQ